MVGTATLQPFDTVTAFVAADVTGSQLFRGEAGH